MLLQSLTLSNHKYYVAIFSETDTCLNDFANKMFLSLSNFFKSTIFQILCFQENLFFKWEKKQENISLWMC